MPDAAAPDAVWERLRERHRRRAATAPRPSPDHHAPEAAILACSDARVPPSVVFDQQPGDLFVVRIAGNAATPPAVASLTYATTQLGTRLVIVLGHTGCGAVTAALAAPADGTFAPILSPIVEVVDGCDDCHDVDATVVANVRATVRRLATDDGPLGRSIRRGEVVVRGAVHDLRSGELVDVDITHLLGGIRRRPALHERTPS